MVDKKDKKKEEQKRVYEPKNGVTLTWDGRGNCFVSMPVNNIPKKQFEEWIRECRFDYSGKGWDRIVADHIKARAYDTTLSMSSPSSQSKDGLPEEKDVNPDGLLNGGRD